ncbi:MULTISPECIES: polymer-forming cytoskeletal protein [unclassified Snodgrassella]|uniref:polymer-forming cytoskeletal protein n=1 Tax=unclassified Snodgrassella TaxID=2625236 RepID=UPI0018DD6AB2|nr:MULTISPECIES: polymer-forming cytoskeletal protein [unclassified Snodgrassella]MBI0097212.1 hypothetical protein [Snodgrassella sp. W8134]MBI0101055.1 hypothetical protein [Snodgrassella sp. W8135]
MEAKEKQLIVTEKWLEKNGARKDELQTFKKHFPNGGEALEILKQCEELDYRYFGEWLVDHLPPTYPPLVLNTLIDSLFYPNDIHIKGDVSIQKFIHIKGILKIDGKLTVNKQQSVLAAFVNADEIDVSGGADIHARIKANSISMSDYAFINGDTVANSISLRDSVDILGNAKAKVINFKGGYIAGDVDADEIINDGGLIGGDVNTIKIQNINGGRVAGKITYKRSDEHK